MKSICLILLLAISATPGCSHFSASARQQRAYTKYLKRSMNNRMRQQTRIHHDQATIPQADTTAPSESRVTAETLQGPQGLPRDSNSQ